MEYRALGKTGLRISAMGFGGIPIQRIDREGTRALILQLREKGINYIDTARGYTVSEEYLGYALEGIRQDFVLATKSMARTKEAMAADILKSLQNLRTEYIDVYQIHNPSAGEWEQIVSDDGALAALQEAKAAGKIGHIGITLHSRDLFDRALQQDWVETIMFPYNIVENQGAAQIAACKEKNIGFIAMKPLAGGAIENATLAMRYVRQNDAVSVIIPGMAEIAELEQNAAAMEGAPELTAAELAEIENIRNTLGTQFCRRCNYCAPCTVGISIPGVFLMEGYLSRYGLADWAKSRYDGMQMHASDCIDCGKCEPRCPYNLPIRKMLKNAAQKFGK